MKLIFLDTETTGLDAKKNDVVEISYQVEIDNVVRSTDTLKFQPVSFLNVDPRALQITGKTMEELQAALPYPKAFEQFMGMLDTFVDKFDKTDKFYVCGYNIGFDFKFLEEWFVKCNHKFFGSYFWRKTIDVMSLAMALDYIYDWRLVDHKLGTVCEKMGIEISAHSSASDIAATRMIFKHIQELAKHDHK